MLSSDICEYLRDIVNCVHLLFSAECDVIRRVPSEKPILLKQPCSVKKQPSSGDASPPHSQSSQDQQPHSHANDYISAPSIPGLDLFQVDPGFNAEEEAFCLEMQQRRKKKCRDPKL